MLSIDVKKGVWHTLRLLASLLAFLKVAGICATAAEEWANYGVLVCLVKNIIVHLDGPWWGVELRPVDLQSISDLKRSCSKSEKDLRIMNHVPG